MAEEEEYKDETQKLVYEKEDEKEEWAEKPMYREGSERQRLHPITGKSSVEEGIELSEESRLHRKELVQSIIDDIMLCISNNIQDMDVEKVDIYDLENIILNKCKVDIMKEPELYTSW